MAWARWSCGDSGAPEGGDNFSTLSWLHRTQLPRCILCAPSPFYFFIHTGNQGDFYNTLPPSRQPVLLTQQHPGVVDGFIHALESLSPAHRLRLQPCRTGMQRLAAVTEREANRQVIETILKLFTTLNVYIRVTPTYARHWDLALPEKEKRNGVILFFWRCLTVWP